MSYRSCKSIRSTYYNTNSFTLSPASSDTCVVKAAGVYTCYKTNSFFYVLTCVKICHATTRVFRPCTGRTCISCLKRVFCVAWGLDLRWRLAATNAARATSNATTPKAIPSPFEHSLHVYASVVAYPSSQIAQSAVWGGRSRGQHEQDRTATETCHHRRQSTYIRFPTKANNNKKGMMRTVRVKADCRGRVLRYR